MQRRETTQHASRALSVRLLTAHRRFRAIRHARWRAKERTIQHVVQHTMCNMQHAHATCSRHVSYNLQYATYNMQHATHNTQLQYATCNMPLAACHLQHATCARHANCNLQHGTCHLQRATCTMRAHGPVRPLQPDPTSRAGAPDAYSGGVDMRALMSSMDRELRTSKASPPRPEPPRCSRTRSASRLPPSPKRANASAARV